MLDVFHVHLLIESKTRTERTFINTQPRNGKQLQRYEPVLLLSTSDKPMEQFDTGRY